MTWIQISNRLYTVRILALCLVASLGLFVPPSTAQQSTPQQDNRLLGHRPAVATVQRRIALIIGNGVYQNVKPLKNPPNDATLVAATLRKLGFEVAIGTDKSQREMKQLIREFGRHLREGGGVGLFYFAGHGVQASGHNYLIPVDADVQSDADLEDGAVDLNYVLNVMRDAQSALNIAILDACRTNPFASKVRSGQNGLAQIEAPSGTLVAYATAPGSTAADGSGANSPYTEELTRQMQSPGVFLETVFRRVAEKVSSRTGGRQEPWFSANVKGDFYFNGTSNLADGNGTQPDRKAKQAMFRDNQGQRDKEWALVNTNSCAEIDLFLRSHHGDFEATLFQIRNCKNDSAGTATKVSQNAQYHLDRGVDHFKAKDYDQVIVDCAELLKLAPKEAIAFTLRGVAYFSKEQYDLAIADFTESIKLDPKSPTAYGYRCRSYEDISNHDRAISDCTEAIRLDPQAKAPHFIRGLAHFFKGNDDQAIADCTEAINLDPNYESAYFVRGAAYSKKHDDDNAISDYTKAINQNPKDGDYYLLRGVAYSNKDDHDKAILDYTEAIRLGNKDADTYARRGTANYDAKHYDAAIADYTEAIRLGKKSAGIYRARGMSYQNKENYDLAIADFTELIKLSPEEPGAYAARALNYYEKGNFDFAAKDCTQAIKLEPQYEAAYEVRALAYDKLGYSEKAEADRQTAKDLERQKRKP